MINYQELHHEVYEKLIRVAKAEEITYYSEVAPLAGLDMGDPIDRIKISDILFRISSYEHQLDHPLLSAVVVLKEGNRPGQGFYTLAADLELYDGDTREEDDRFLIEELNRIYKHWR
jgi:hypothetical protein